MFMSQRYHWPFPREGHKITRVSLVYPQCSCHKLIIGHFPGKVTKSRGYHWSILSMFKSQRHHRPNLRSICRKVIIGLLSIFMSKVDNDLPSIFMSEVNIGQPSNIKIDLPSFFMSQCFNRSTLNLHASKVSLINPQSSCHNSIIDLYPQSSF